MSKSKGSKSVWWSNLDVGSPPYVFTAIPLVILAAYLGVLAFGAAVSYFHRTFVAP